MPDWGSIPWLGVIVAVVAAQIIGFLWYGPLFGKPWRAAMGGAEGADTSGLGAAVAVGVLCSLATAIALALLLSLSDSPDEASGIKVGLLVAVAVVSYLVITMMYEQRNRTLSWISSANQIVTLGVMGCILGAMW
ncbi:MAG: DUF1761 domain-containing protein [Actinobacteria bacterium]|nr:DUF1761 domain-containing protein [Actinomycetota bacterium]